MVLIRRGEGELQFPKQIDKWCRWRGRKMVLKRQQTMKMARSFYTSSESYGVDVAMLREKRSWRY